MSGDVSDYCLWASFWALAALDADSARVRRGQPFFVAGKVALCLRSGLSPYLIEKEDLTDAHVERALLALEARDVVERRGEDGGMCFARKRLAPTPPLDGTGQAPAKGVLLRAGGGERYYAGDAEGRPVGDHSTYRVVVLEDDGGDVPPNVANGELGAVWGDLDNPKGFTADDVERARLKMIGEARPELAAKGPAFVEGLRRKGDR